MTISPDRIRLQTERVDLVKRLFAVAFSFGFAVRFQELLGKASDNNMATSARLFIGMVFVVICWDWYHRDIKKSINETYYSILRFFLDVIITFAYATLLYLSYNGNYWCFMFFAIFFLFFIWDILAISELPYHDPELPTNDQELQKYHDLYRVLSWMFYFLCLWAIQVFVSGPALPALSQVFSCLFIIVGISIFRYDVNAVRKDTNGDTWKDTKWGRYFTSIIRCDCDGNADTWVRRRIIYIIVLLLLYVLFENFEFFVKLLLLLFKNFELLVKGS